MKKVIIIDDRKERKKMILDDGAIQELCGLCDEGVLTICESIKCDDFYDLNDFSLIAVHQSYLIDKGLFGEMVKYTEQNNKLLVIFSGGITQNLVFNYGHQLNINAEDFYSSRLVDFVKKYSTSTSMEYPLLQFLYGETWKLSLLFQYKNLLWIYGDEIDIIADSNIAQKEENIRRLLAPGEDVLSISWINEQINQERGKEFLL